MKRLTLALFLVGSFAMAKCPSKSSAEDQKKETVGFLLLGKELCSGTLLSPHVVLTAAHCLEGFSPSKVSFTLSSDLSEGKKGASFATAAEFRVHPYYRKAAGKNAGGADLALVRLSSTSYGKEQLVFYTLGDDSGLSNGTTAYTLGYGVEPNGSVKIRRSRRVRFDSRKDSQLRDGKYLKGGLLKFVRGDEGQIPCGGDSGSPILKFIDDKTAIVAVHSAAEAFFTSSRQGASLEKTPNKLCQASASAYGTSVSAFHEWIEGNRKNLETDKSHPRCP